MTSAEDATSSTTDNVVTVVGEAAVPAPNTWTDAVPAPNTWTDTVPVLSTWTDAAPVLITGHRLNSSITTPSTGYIAQSGTYSSAMTTSRTPNDSWIVDSGASDHMTSNDSLFSTLAPCKTSLQVKIAYGTMAKVLGIGSVKISDTITLLNVLHVPTLACNLLSISKLTQDNHCSANFQSHNCTFQDLASGKTIGRAEEYNGLYHLGSSIFPAFNKVVLSANCPPDILLWHYRLGHPNFHYMQKFFLDKIETQTELTEFPNPDSVPQQQTQTTHDNKFGKVYTRRNGIQTENHTTPMMQTENPMSSSADSEGSNEGLNLPIAIRKGITKQFKYEHHALSKAASWDLKEQQLWTLLSESESDQVKLSLFEALKQLATLLPAAGQDHPLEMKTRRGFLALNVPCLIVSHNISGTNKKVEDSHGCEELLCTRSASRSLASISSTVLGDLQSTSRNLRRSLFGNLGVVGATSSSPTGNSIAMPPLPTLPAGSSTPAAIRLEINDTLCACTYESTYV
ncbi:Retrovirus-related Pol polyprotein from transposon TNT 1-94 [Senna tora]|uniref:Retrovirus-related Pol polyprotein from transposon TNT 1-94 n=1 Tax=Senna tora TaxID=362788 RepID=A0A834XC68_9FABA|nr:Retrovirus-related Pol polyprotein from transposon TNT 1-94 [Senna tora]